MSDGTPRKLAVVSSKHGSRRGNWRGMPPFDGW